MSCLNSNNVFLYYLRMTHNAAKIFSHCRIKCRCFRHISGIENVYISYVYARLCFLSQTAVGAADLTQSNTVCVCVHMARACTVVIQGFQNSVH